MGSPGKSTAAATPSSRGSSRCRDRTPASYIGRWGLYCSAAREAPERIRLLNPGFPRTVGCLRSARGQWVCFPKVSLKARLSQKAPRPGPAGAAHHSCFCSAGSKPVDGSSRSRTGGSPSRLSTEHSCKAETRAGPAAARHPPGSPRDTRTFLAAPRGSFCAGTFSCSCSLKASTSLVGNRVRSGEGVGGR